MRNSSNHMFHPQTLPGKLLAFALLLFLLVPLSCSATTPVIVEKPPVQPERPLEPVQQYPPACEQGDSPIYNIPVSRDDPVLGDAQTAVITIIEFMDFQCPFCKKASETLQELMDAYPGKIRMVFKHRPLKFHRNALSAAKAAVAAQRQGKFWQMAQYLFENGRSLDEDHLFGFASQLGLDMYRFKHDYSAPETMKKIEDDIELAENFGIRATPILFINGRELRGARPLSNFKDIVDKLLVHAKTVGGSGDDLYQRLVACGLTKKKTVTPKQKTTLPKQDPNRVYNIPVGNSYWTGGQDAAVELIVFSDFQCPFCARHAGTLKEILTRYGRTVKIVFKNLPLSFHENSMIAAEAAMAAGAQGKFWQMHDLLFKNRTNLGRQALEDYAAELGLDLQRFKSDLDKHTFANAIKHDMELAKEFGINGTPSTFINGKRLSGARPLKDFADVIEKALGH